MYKIVIDSCGELPDSLKQDEHFCNVPLELDVDGFKIRDDETFNQLDFLRRVKESVAGPKSACPSPEAYMEAFKGDAENIYVVTLSGKLSGSYNSAVLAANLYNEEHGDAKKNIHVFNSKSASIGETIIGLKCQEFEKAGLSFEEVCEKTEEYISSMNTFFVLETLETLRKAGRLSNLSQARGMKKALTKMVDSVISTTKDCENRILAISHCNCPERAEYVKECIEKIATFKEIFIVNTAGVSSMYANDGGVIIAV